MIIKRKEEITAKERKIIIELLKEYSLLKKKSKLDILNDGESERYRLLTSALLLLNEREQEVIRLTYIDNEDDLFDYIVQDKLRLSARTYYRIKDSAINKIYNFLPNSLFNAS